MARSRFAQATSPIWGWFSAEAGVLLGFRDPSSFNRAFRRWTGSSPGRRRPNVL